MPRYAWRLDNQLPREDRYLGEFATDNAAMLEFITRLAREPDGLGGRQVNGFTLEEVGELLDYVIVRFDLVDAVRQNVETLPIYYR